MYKIVICDDDKNYIQELESIIKECNIKQRSLEFIEFHSGEELLQNLPMDSDVMFMDVQLNGMDGNETALRAVKAGYQGLLVQYSDISMSTPDTIKRSPYRYLLKQADKVTTYREIYEILEEMDRQKICFTIEASYMREKYIIRTEDIVYFSHHKRWSAIHMNKEQQEHYSEASLITSYNFRELHEMLYPLGFVSPHRSYLINLRYVSAFNQTKEYVKLDGIFFPVARTKVDQFTKDFTRYVNLNYKGKLM